MDTIADAIVIVLGSRAPCQIIEAVVQLVVIQVAGLLSFQPWPNKRLQKRAVNRQMLGLTVLARPYLWIPIPSDA